MLIKGSTEDIRTIILPYILLELSLLFKNVCFLCHVLVYKWCWITSFDFYRQ